MMEEPQQQHENSASFWTSFTKSISMIRNTLRLLGPDKAEDLETIQKLKLQLSNLQVYATESTPLLPPYDVRRSQEELETLGREIKEKELLLKPKKKFSFASRSTSLKASVVLLPVEVAKEVIAEEETVTPLPPGSYAVTSRKNETIMLSPSELKLVSAFGANVQLLLKDCENVLISSPTIHGSVRLEKMVKCRIFLGPCCTSVYIEECSEIEVFLACHQLRIHKSHNSKLYVRVNSHPIIEDCTGFGFAPYNITYDSIDDDFKASALTDAKCWDSVVDFRWHRTTPSPHWHVIPPLERIQGLPEEILDAGWSLILPVKIDNSSVEKCEEKIESKIGSLIIETDNLKNEIKEEIEDEEEL